MRVNGLVSRVLDRLSALQVQWAASRVEQRRRRQVIRELSAFNDRELLELGFHRSDFPAIANGTYRR